MPFTGTVHRSTPIFHFHPPLSLHRTVARFPIRQRPRVAPTVLPILQPPAFCKKSDFIYEDGEDQQQHAETHDQLAIMHTNHTKKQSQQIAIRIPAFIPQQNYPKQPLLCLTARAARRMEARYPPHFFCIR
ncbi:unnamed protein product [Adineta ricciae]|uniref:Uncharacterized protein n=1 Tax=Adineta ricciae TaxID=249248 RepID=A0A813NBD1_ADIRI|nr:unnamed protein product [Adineta ricciae]CAF1109042.1 unnamed protein product [Adineta ricciae]